ncbi:MAG: tetratricopeptide repeat protein [Candidatus Obscuribacterales bacterium]|nr:tetratricopeptide repeat protein [Candidatus Obscuribacterales bacterium]
MAGKAVLLNISTLFLTLMPLAQAAENTPTNSNISAIERLKISAVNYQQKNQPRKSCEIFSQLVLLQSKILGEEHPDVADTLSNWAMLYQKHEQNKAARQLLTRAYNIKVKNFGTKNVTTLDTLSQLADLFIKQEEYAEAQRILSQVLSARKEISGDKHPSVAKTILRIAYLDTLVSKPQEAEKHYKQALSIYSFSAFNHEETGAVLHELGILAFNQGEYDKAESLLKRAVNIRENFVRSAPEKLASSLNGLASVYTAQGKTSLAEPGFLRAQTLVQNKPAENKLQADISSRYSTMLRLSGRNKDAEQLEKQRQIQVSHIFHEQL